MDEMSVCFVQTAGAGKSDGDAHVSAASSQKRDRWFFPQTAALWSDVLPGHTIHPPL